MKQQFFLFGYYGWKNTGDDAMLCSLLEEIHHLNPKITFAVLSPIPVVVPPEVEGKTKFIKPSLFMVAKEILKSSVLVIGGGTHLFDYGIKTKILNMQLRIFLLVLYAKILGKKVYILGNGLGPFHTTWGKFLPRLICYLADYISVRDKASYNLSMGWGFTDKTYLAFDLSVLIKPSCENEISSVENSKRILGISVTPVFELYHSSKEKDLGLINEISRCINDWLKHEPQAEVWLFTFHGQSRDDDISITRLLQEKLEPQDRIKLVSYNPDPEEMIARVGQCNTFIGMKYHS